jgi:hypothetical protein
MDMTTPLAQEKECCVINIYQVVQFNTSTANPSMQPETKYALAVSFM